MTYDRLIRSVGTACGAVALMAIVGCASLKRPWYQDGKVEPATVGQTPHLTTFGNHVYFAPQPATDDFKAFSEKGVKTVINLRTPQEMTFDERAAVTGAGMEYIQVPVGKDEPPEEEINRAMDALDKADKEPVLMHCHSSNRVGYMWAMYRGTRHGLPVEDAIAEGKAAGLKSPQLEERARAYIKRKTAK
ncbi:protein tyrosine phosphatase family protein [Candidatus Sumerlaeota bacterium]|nr:protein tyrosine phosphatase family protein [Candidatus Sumerlaeota bacterium]